jgi:hypothetical protein
MASLVRTLAVAAILAFTPVIAESQQAKIPSGTYVMVPDSGFALDVPIASITLVFADSTMTANMDGQMIIRSRLTHAGDQVTMTDFEGEMACGTPAKYKLEITAKGMRLTPIEDACEQRSSVLAAVTLVKSMQH